MKFRSAADGSGIPEDAPELMHLIDFLQSSPLAEAIAAGEFELPERPREGGREVTFEDEDPDG